MVLNEQIVLHGKCLWEGKWGGAVIKFSIFV
jgi:hypothetical protein